MKQAVREKERVNKNKLKEVNKNQVRLNLASYKIKKS